MPDDHPSVMETENAYLLPTYSRLPIALTRGEGSFVWDIDGRRFLDFYGGHCVTALGHCPPRVTRAVQEQSETLMFYSNVVYSPVRARAARLLGDLSPAGMQNIFFCNSGTEANETALKLVRMATGRSGIVAMHGGFHGRTLGSLAATGFPHYRAPHEAVLAPAHFVAFGDAGAVARVLQEDDGIAAVVVEPIQSMAGVRTAPDDYFVTLRRLCDESGSKLIFDEVQTGVGRTGAFTYAQRIGVTPDAITMAKSLGSGVPVGAVLASDDLAATVNSGDHGTTFGGGMVAMAAVAATLEELVDGGWMDRSTAVFRRISEALSGSVVQVRGAGCLIGIELDEDAAPVLARLRARGVLAGGSSHARTIRIMPPLNATDAEVDLFVQTLLDVLTPQPVDGDA